MKSPEDPYGRTKKKKNGENWSALTRGDEDER
jgi:hypothetical protein